MTTPSGVLEIDALISSADLSSLSSGGYTMGTGFALATPTLVSYAFPTPTPTQSSQGYGAFGEVDKAQAREALALFSQVCGIRFVENVATPSDADMRFMWDTNFAAHFGAYAGITHLTFSTDNYASSDIYFNPSSVASSTSVWNGIAAGEAGFLTFLHEIGHAVGLKHPGNYGTGTEDSPYLSAALDSTAYTVMSYNDWHVSGPWGAYTYPGQPMSLDVAALQCLYGPAGSAATSYATNLSWSAALNGFVGTSENERTVLANMEIGQQWPGTFSSEADGAIHYHYASHVVDMQGGTDLLRIDAASAAARLARLSGGSYELSVGVPYSPSNPQGHSWVTDFSEVLSNVERLQFSDQKIALDLGVSQAAGEAALLIGAVLGRSLAFANDPIKKTVLGNAVALFDDPQYDLQILSGAIMRLNHDDLDIWTVLAGGNDATHIARHVLTVVNGSAPDQASLDAAIAALGNEAGSLATQGSWLAGQAASAANQAQIDLVGLAQTGMAYL